MEERRRGVGRHWHSVKMSCKVAADGRCGAVAVHGRRPVDWTQVDMAAAYVKITNRAAPRPCRYDNAVNAGARPELFVQGRGKIAQRIIYACVGSAFFKALDQSPCGSPVACKRGAESAARVHVEPCGLPPWQAASAFLAIRDCRNAAAGLRRHEEGHQRRAPRRAGRARPAAKDAHGGRRPAPFRAGAEKERVRKSIPATRAAHVRLPRGSSDSAAMPGRNRGGL